MMGLSTKNRKLVGGLVIVGALGGGGLVLKAIDFAGSGTGTVLNQAPKLKDPGVSAIGTAGDWSATGVEQLGKLQAKLDNLSNASTTSPAAGAPAAPGAAGNPDS